MYIDQIVGAFALFPEPYPLVGVVAVLIRRAVSHFCFVLFHRVVETVDRRRASLPETSSGALLLSSEVSGFPGGTHDADRTGAYVPPASIPA